MAQERLSHGGMNSAVALGLVLEDFLVEVVLLLLKLLAAQETGRAGLVERSTLDLE
jgi:hypothetical protein